MKNKKISIIIPIYNVEKYLRKCLNSVVNQTYKDIEIILVDDGSTDNSGEIADEYVDIDSRIIVIHKSNGGLSSARNAGIDIATGKYLGFVDSDDWIEVNMYNNLVSLAEKYNADIVESNYFNVYDNKIKSRVNTHKIKIFNNIEGLEDYLRGGNLKAVIWNKLYRKTLFENIKFPYGKLHEDEFTTYKLLYRANIIVYVDSAYYFYLQRNNSIMNCKYNMKRLDAIEAFEERNIFFKTHEDINFKKLYLISEIKYASLLVIHYFIIRTQLGKGKIEELIKEKILINKNKFIKNIECNLKLKIQLNLFEKNPDLMMYAYKLFVLADIIKQKIKNEMIFMMNSKYISNGNEYMDRNVSKILQNKNIKNQKK